MNYRLCFINRKAEENFWKVKKDEWNNFYKREEWGGSLMENLPEGKKSWLREA